MSGTPAIRLLQDPPLDGPTNMARDEALMTRVGAFQSPPTLRLYEWSRPTVSLGYFQRFADFAALPPPLSTLAVVRRLTGGGAILHDLELTYSLTLPSNHPLLADGPNRLYELVHDAVISSLAPRRVQADRGGRTDDSTPTRGPFFCFARRHRFDVILDGAKLAGSAQRRTQAAVLQHGSIILGNRFSQQPTAIVDIPAADGISFLRDDLPAEFARTAGLAVSPGDWLPAEPADAEVLVAKYAGDVWTRRA